MSVVIKGMKLPLPGNMMVCALIDGKLQCSIVTKDKPIEWCEVLEVPTPHGRLIDADRLYDLVENRYRVSCGIEHRCERDLLDLICEMPTIIEAEASE